MRAVLFREEDLQAAAHKCRVAMASSKGFRGRWVLRMKGRQGLGHLDLRRRLARREDIPRCFCSGSAPLCSDPQRASALADLVPIMHKAHVAALYRLHRGILSLCNLYNVQSVQSHQGKGVLFPQQPHITARFYTMCREQKTLTRLNV